MPQDIPLEASETLAFTPEAFADLGEAAPKFVLRAATHRDKQYHRRLHIEEKILNHSLDAIRAEVLNGLKAMWSEEAFEQHSGTLTAYWDAKADYEQQKAAHDAEHAGEKGAPEFGEFDYDPAVRAACEALVSQVTENWRPIRKMVSDNADYGELAEPAMVAVVVQSWTGIDLKFAREPGLERTYLSFACAQQIPEALAKIERANGLPEGRAWSQLYVACSRRLYLTEDEAKNSASPSPSETTPAASSPTSTSDADGLFPASATSPETPATA